MPVMTRTGKPVLAMLLCYLAKRYVVIFITHVRILKISSDFITKVRKYLQIQSTYTLFFICCRSFMPIDLSWLRIHHILRTYFPSILHQNQVCFQVCLSFHDGSYRFTAMFVMLTPVHILGDFMAKYHNPHCRYSSTISHAEAGLCEREDSRASAGLHVQRLHGSESS